MKTCFKCNEEKPLSEFYKHKQMGDGHLNKCKDCTKRDSAQHYRANREYYAEYERKRSQDPERKRKIVEYQRTGRAKNPERYKATNAVTNAIRDGRLEKEPCEICGKENAEAHHDDYSKPLDVRWLCRKHHLEHHGKVAYEDD